MVLSHHTSLYPHPYRHVTISIYINIHMNIAISLHPILCSQWQSWSHSHSQSRFTTRNPLLDFNRIGPCSDTSSDLDTLPLSSTSLFGHCYTAVLSTLDPALMFATPYLVIRSWVLVTLGQPILGKLRLPIMSRSSLTFLGELVSR
jgi:hypothetical protein